MTSTHDRVAEWDAAYVLGALSPADRREFETHLEDCERCRAAVAELGGLPGLLGRLDAPRALALLDDSESAAQPGPPADLVARISARDRRARRRARFGIAGAMAAAAAVAAVLALVIPSVLAPAPALAAELVPVRDGVPVQASIELTRVAWGTRIDMDCGYHAAAPGDDTGYGATGPVAYSMWVVDRSGAESQLSTWSASPGGDVSVTAGTALGLGDIAEVEVRTADGETVLLAAEL